MILTGYCNCVQNVSKLVLTIVLVGLKLISHIRMQSLRTYVTNAWGIINWNPKPPVLWYTVS